MAVASSFLHAKETQQRQSLSAMTLRPSGNREALDLHRAQRHVDSRATYLDSDNGVQDTDCSLERLQEAVLVRDNTRYWPVWIRRQAPAWMFSLGRRLETCVFLRL